MPAASERPKSTAVRKLGLGAALFGRDCSVGTGRGRLSDSEAQAAVALAVEAGVRLVDTGAQYGDSESVLGRILPKTPLPDCPLRLLTKTASLSQGPHMVEAAARASILRLGIDRASAVIVHSASDLLADDGPELWTRLQKLKGEGLFDAVGVSACASDDPVGLARRFKPDLMQLPVSVLDQRLIVDGTLSTLSEMGVEIHLRSVFQQGLLFLPRAGLPAKLVGAGPRLSRIRRNIAEAGADPLQAALTFAMNLAQASAVIVGVASAAELRAVLAAAVKPCPSLDWSALRLDDPVALDPKLWAA